MDDRRFFNQFQPQTLQIAVLLLYIQAFFALLAFSSFAILLAAAMAAGAYGIANERRWGYGLAVTAAVLQLGILLLVFGFDVLGFPVVLSLLIDGALVALLLHPQSRDYQRIWFK